MSFVPTDYDAWKTCITQACGIPLTPDYIQSRINALSDPSNFQTQQFIERWGPSHHARTLGWFERAATESKADPGR